MVRAGPGLFIIAVIVLYIVSFISGGFVYILSPLLIWLASTPVVVIICEFLAFLAFLALIVASMKRRRYGGLRRGMFFLGVTALMILLIFGAFITHQYSLEWTSGVIEVKHLDRPITVIGLQRFIPIKTAYAYATDRIQIPTHRIVLEDCYVYFRNGTILYNWIIEPEGFWNQISKPALGVVFVDASKYPPKVTTVDKELSWGLHTLRITPFYISSLDRELRAFVGLSKLPLLVDNVEVVHNGKVYILVPIMTWLRGLTTSIPILYGYVAIDEEGNFEFLRPEEVLNDPRFEGVPLVPEVIARAWVDIYRYHVGIWNVILYHNTYVVRDVGANPQPYLLVDNDGNLWWVFVAEPPGETYATKYIFYVNASKLEPHLYIYELPEPMVGISKVESYIKQHHPMFDWSQVTIEEPMPSIINGTLYWKVTLTTVDGRGLISVDLVNAKTSRVLSFKPGKEMNYLDLLKSLTKETIEELPKEGKSLVEEVRELRKQVEELISVLEGIKERLIEIEERLGNYTST